MFDDRTEAGVQLAQELEKVLPERNNAIVVALTRGGVPVALEVSSRLSLPLDILVVRKLGFPTQEELGFGAIAPNGYVYTDAEIVSRLNVTDTELTAEVDAEERELKRRIAIYRGDSNYDGLYGKNVILVDDGLATGVTMHAAIGFVRKQRPVSIIVAVPVSAADSVQKIKKSADMIVSLLSPLDFLAVGEWYRSFPQLTDSDVISILKNSNTLKYPPGAV